MDKATTLLKSKAAKDGKSIGSVTKTVVDGERKYLYEAESIE